MFPVLKCNEGLLRQTSSGASPRLFLPAFPWQVRTELNTSFTWHAKLRHVPKLKSRMKEIFCVEMETNLLHMPLKGYLHWQRCRMQESLATLQFLILVCTFQHIPAKLLPFYSYVFIWWYQQAKEAQCSVKYCGKPSYFPVSDSAGICPKQQAKELVADVILRDILW